jgi:hypothetical protein
MVPAGAGRPREGECQSAHAQAEQYSSHDKLQMREFAAHAEGMDRVAWEGMSAKGQ